MATRQRATCGAWCALRLLCAVAIFGLLLPRPLWADDRTTFLIDRLRYPPAPGQSDDFRVRTNAALQLGRTNDDAAVQPLCGALSDPSDVVRIAAAAALKRLARPSALPCLKDRLGAESSDGAKSQIQQTIDALAAAAGGGGGGGGGGGSAKYYVALAKVTNNTTRPQADIEGVVLGAIRQKLSSLGSYQLAPANETPAAARAVLSSKNLKGFYLTVAIDAFDYSGGNLRVKLKLTISGYPGKDLRAFLDKSATQSGATPGDRNAENGLLEALAGSVIDQFAQSFP
jgi:HEAT repeats